MNKAVLTTAIQIDDATARRICERIEKYAGIKDMVWSRNVDLSIIGGFKADIGDYVFDMSVDAQLGQIVKMLQS